MSVLENLFLQKQKKIFLQTEDKSYSYEWLLGRMGQITGLFRQLNIHSGARILLAVSDEADMSALFLASMQNGITVVMADPESKSPRAKSIIAKTKPAYQSVNNTHGKGQILRLSRTIITQRRCSRQ